MIICLFYLIFTPFGKYSVKNITELFLEFHRKMGKWMKSFQIKEFLGFSDTFVEFR